jgi:hypothetical protein
MFVGYFSIYSPWIRKVVHQLICLSQWWWILLCPILFSHNAIWWYWQDLLSTFSFMVPWIKPTLYTIILKKFCHIGYDSSNQLYDNCFLCWLCCYLCFYSVAPRGLLLGTEEENKGTLKFLWSVFKFKIWNAS